MNIWFSHIWWFDDEECSNFQSFSKFEPLEVYGFASPNEAVRYGFPYNTIIDNSHNLSWFLVIVLGGGGGLGGGGRGGWRADLG